MNLSSHLWSPTDDGTSGSGGGGNTDSGNENADPGDTMVSCVERCELKVGSESFLFLNLYGKDKASIDGAVNNIKIENSGDAVLSIEEKNIWNETTIASASRQSASIVLRLRGKQAGKSTITASLSNGNSTICEVMVKGTDGKKAVPVNSNNPYEVAAAVAFSLLKLDASTKIGTENLKTEVSYDVKNKLVKVLNGVDTSGKAGIDGTTDNRMCNASWSEEYNQFKSLYKQMTGLEAKKSDDQRRQRGEGIY